MKSDLLQSARIIYFNDVGGIKHKEQQVLEGLREQGIDVLAVNVEWRASEKFADVLARLSSQVRGELKHHKRVVLVGAGASGSMAISIMAKLREKRLFTITLCSRLVETELPKWDRRSLERVAYIGKPNESKLYFDSVLYCTDVSVPKLTKSDKSRIVTAHQRADPSIPRQTMRISGVNEFKIAGYGHASGIVRGMLCLPSMMRLY